MIVAIETHAYFSFHWFIEGVTIATNSPPIIYSRFKIPRNFNTDNTMHLFELKKMCCESFFKFMR